MYLTKQYPDGIGTHLILTRCQPRIWESEFYPKHYDLCHSIVYIDSSYFPNITFDMGPQEVTLIRKPNSDKPMIYLQRLKNSDGSVDLYYGNGLNGYTKWEKSEKKWWEFWKDKYAPVRYFVCNGVYTGSRLPRKWFPEVTIEDGPVGYDIVLVNK